MKLQNINIAEKYIKRTNGGIIVDWKALYELYTQGLNKLESFHIFQISEFKEFNQILNCLAEPEIGVLTKKSERGNYFIRGAFEGIGDYCFIKLKDAEGYLDTFHNIRSSDIQLLEIKEILPKNIESIIK
jgi:hypothetical protein